jgi:RNase P/RNase MRP subunit p30
LFVDLNLGKKELGAEAKALGWQGVCCAKNVFLKNSGDLGKLGEKELCAVETNNVELAIQALERGKFHLLNPFPLESLEKSVFKKAVERGILFEIPLYILLHNSFAYRAKAIARARSVLRKCVAHGARFVFTSRAQEEMDLKSPLETIAIAEFLGLNRAQAKQAISETPRELLEGIGLKSE